MPQSASVSEPKLSTTTVWDGVYAAAQAQRGNAAYLEKCAGCHKDDLSGYQGVLKNSFMRLWREDNLRNLYTIIKNTNSNLGHQLGKRYGPAVYRKLFWYGG